MFFVEIDPSDKNKDVYNIQYITNAVVTIEPVRKTGDLVQCHRCQEFGHTKSYCRKQFRCVKCAEGHATNECTKKIETPARCIHCDQNHTANYKGCPIYQNLTKKPTRYTAPYNTEIHSLHNYNSSSRVEHVSYADAAKSSQFNTNNNNNTNNANNINNINNTSNENFMTNMMYKMETLFNKQTEFINNVMSMLTLILKKVCK